MSNNIPKRLAIKAELLRHLNTAEQMENDNKPSSGFKVLTLQVEIALFDRGHEPNLEFWRKSLGQ